MSCQKILDGMYNCALDLYQSSCNEEALKVLDELQQMTAVWLRPFLLKAYILRKMDCHLQELQVIHQLLAQVEQIENPSESDNDVVAEAWSLLGEVLVKLGECRLAVDAFLQSSCMERDIKKKREEYSNAIFVANYCSDISDAHWQELYWLLCANDITRTRLRYCANTAKQ